MSETMLEQIRILIVDDHAMFLEGLAGLLDREPDMQVVDKCASTAEALDRLEQSAPTMILLDFDLGGERAVDFVLEVKRRGFSRQILVVTAGVNDQEAVQLIRAGVAGILHKHNTPDILCRTIREVAAGAVSIEPGYLKTLFQSLDETRGGSRVTLSARDKSVLRCIFQGLANKEIGARLDMSESAVKAALRQLFQRLGVRTRAHLVKVALEQYRDQL